MMKPAISRPRDSFTAAASAYLGVQLLGVVTVCAWVIVSMFIVFKIIEKTIGLRVSADKEIAGLDSREHGLPSAYADFMPTSFQVPTILGTETSDPVSMSEAVPVTHIAQQVPEEHSEKITKLVIITKQSRFEALKEALSEIGVTGMTVTQVLGCGMQKGVGEFYRGISVDVNLLPKVKVEIVVCKVPVEMVVNTAKRVLYTGHIGDGKIFIYDVENVIKIRTGEEGYAALQDE